MSADAHAANPHVVKNLASLFCSSGGGAPCHTMPWWEKCGLHQLGRCQGTVSTQMGVVNTIKSLGKQLVLTTARTALENMVETVYRERFDFNGVKAFNDEEGKRIKCLNESLYKLLTQSVSSNSFFSRDDGRDDERLAEQEKRSNCALGAYLDFHNNSTLLDFPRRIDPRRRKDHACNEGARLLNIALFQGTPDYYKYQDNKMVVSGELYQMVGEVSALGRSANGSMEPCQVGCGPATASQRPREGGKDEVAPSRRSFASERQDLDEGPRHKGSYGHLARDLRPARGSVCFFLPNELNVYEPVRKQMWQQVKYRVSS